MDNDTTKTKLAYDVGTRLEAYWKPPNGSTPKWVRATVTMHNYHHPSWPPHQTVPYQLKLDNGLLIFSPREDPAFIRPVKNPNDTPEYPDLRFAVGDHVEAIWRPAPASEPRWLKATVDELWFRRKDWPEDRVAPYKLKLDSGEFVLSPSDSDQCIRESVPDLSGGTLTATSPPSAAEPLPHAVHEAAVDLDMQSVVKWLSAADIGERRVDCRGPQGRTLLMTAVLAKAGDKLVRELLSRWSPSLEAREAADLSALQLAVLRSRKVAVEALLSAGAEVDAADSRGGTALHLAVFLGDAQIAKLLLDKGADKAVVHTKLERDSVELAKATGNSMLAMILTEPKTAAFVEKQRDIAFDARAWLATNAAAEMADKMGAPVLQYCEKVRAVASMARAAAGESTADDANSPNVSLSSGDEAALAPTRKGRRERRAFSAVGQTPPGSPGSPNGKPPLMPLMVLLVRIKTATEQEVSNLAAVVRNFEEEFCTMLKAMCSSGVELDEPIDMGRTLLMQAACFGGPTCTKALLDAGANAGYVSTEPPSTGCTPLLLAASEGHLECVRMLLKAGAAVDPPVIPAKEGGEKKMLAWSAVYAAVVKGRVEVVRLLLRAGASVKFRHPATGISVLECARAHGHYGLAHMCEEAEMLEAAGGSPQQALRRAVEAK